MESRSLAVEGEALGCRQIRLQIPRISQTLKTSDHEHPQTAKQLVHICLHFISSRADVCDRIARTLISGLTAFRLGPAVALSCRGASEGSF